MARPLIVGHRGASSEAPENTLASFRRAGEQGADAVEMDVHLTRDLVPVVIHDPRLLRTTRVDGWVRDKTLAELKELDAGRFFNPRFAGERIPTLEEAAGAFPGRLFVEVKDSMRSVDRVVQALRDAGALGRATLCAFHPFVLRQARGHSTTLLVAESSPNILKRPVGWWLSGARGVAPFYTLAQSFLKVAKPRGVPVYPWTVDSIGIARRLMEAGAAGIITNRPGRMVKLRDELGR